MSIGAPWGFGINRAEIQQLVRELAILGSGLPPEKVFISDVAARAPRPPRPWISIQLGSAIVMQRTGNDERIWQSKEQWLVTVNTVAGDPQRLTVIGVDYDYTAASGDVTATRDGLLAAIGAPAEFTAVGVGTNQIQIDSTLDGRRLEVMPGAGNDIGVVQVVSNAYIRNLRPFELQCNVQCSGLMDIDAPATTQSGQSIADLVEMTISSVNLTERMRDCGHVPVRISRIFDGTPLNDQQSNMSTVQVVIATTGRIDVSISSVTEINTEVTVTQ